MEIQVSQPKLETKKEVAYIERTIGIEKGGKPRKVKVREIPIEWEGKKEIVTLKKWSFGERAKFTEKFLKIEMIGEIPKTNIDMVSMQMESLLTGIHEAPFPITRDYIEYELDGGIGEKLHKEIEKFNKLNPTKEKN